jgi:CBS domain containing-hemolysin-like protein
LLVGLNAFFVASEFALVAVDRGRVEQRARDGNRTAQVISSLLKELSFHLSGAQLGISLSSLVLGFVAGPAVAGLLEAPLDALGLSGTGLSVALALVLATGFQMVLGELVPKTVAIAHPLATGAVLARPTHWFGVVFGPLTRALNGLANWTVRKLGVEPVEELASVRSIEDLEFLIRSSGEGGGIDLSDVQLLTRSIRFAEKDAAEVLVPRVDVTAVQADETVADLVARAGETGYSRFPVVVTDLDDVVGVAHVKAAYDVPRDAWARTRVETIMYQVRAVPESRGLESLLTDLRSRDGQLAVVVDEHGGTSGIVTLEDVLEEIVGEIDDEHDPLTDQALTPVRPPGVHELEGSLHRDEVDEATGFAYPDGGYETIAGFLLDRLGHIPVVGERVEQDGWIVEVAAMDRLRIATVRLTEPRVRRNEDDAG